MQNKCVAYYLLFIYLFSGNARREGLGGMGRSGAGRGEARREGRVHIQQKKSSSYLSRR